MKINHGFEQISSCPNCRVKAADLFDSGLSENARADFAQMTQARSYAPGEILFAEGNAPSGVFLVDAGRVKLAHLADERPQVVKIARTGDVLGLGATLPIYIGHLVTYIEDHAHGDTAPFVLSSASRKVAAFLLESARSDGHETGEGLCVELQVTFGELSAMLFLRTDRMENVFDRFEDRHWIYRGQRTVTVLDQAALQAVSQGADAN